MPQVIARAAVTEALCELLGRGLDDPVDDNAKPIGDLGFTSPDGLDFVCELEKRLGVKIPNNLNPFVDDARRRARSVREIVEWVEEQLPGWSESHHV